MIKTALALQHRQIPPVVHFRRGNEKIKFDEYNLKVPQKLEPWPKKDKALAGVSSFGFGGANAHLVLEGISVDAVNSSALGKERKMAFVKPLVISAQTKEGLTENATKWISHLQKSEESFHEILSTAALRLQHYGHRVGILCRSREDAIAGLEALVDGSERTRYVEGHVPETQAGSARRLVFVFNGMGTQWFGMGQALLQAEPVFREIIARFDKVLKSLKCSWSVMEQLQHSQFKDRIHETEYAQPTICAVQMALTELLKKYDVIPDVVIGHSVGEMAAAYACAKLSFQNAVYVIDERARALKKTSGSGTMLAATVSQREVEEINATNEAVFAEFDIAAVNSASQTVLSGSRTDTDAPSIAMMSTVTADYVSSEQVNGADYWLRNIRYTVHFKDAIERLLTDGYSHFLEIGAHPALMSVIRDVIATSKEKPKKFSVMPTLRRKGDPKSSIDGQFHIMSTLLQLFCEQDHNSLPVIFHDKYHVVSLPTYSWQRGECGQYSSLLREAILYAEAANEILHDFHSYAYHPAFFDGLLHGYILKVLLGGQMLAERRKEPFHYSTEVPYSFDEVELYGEPTEKIVMHVKSYVKEGIRYADVRAADINTNIIFYVMTGIRFDALPDANNNNALHTWSLSWQPFDIDNHPRVTGARVETVVIVCDKEEDANQLAAAMKREGSTDVKWVPIQEIYELPRKCNQLTQKDAVVLYMDPVEEDCGQMDADQFTTAIDDSCITAASVLLKVNEAFPNTPPRVWMVTRGAAYVQTGDIPQPCLNTVHSTALAAVHEFYLNPTASVDLSQYMELAEDAAILARLVVPPLMPENEFAVRPTEKRRFWCVVSPNRSPPICYRRPCHGHLETGVETSDLLPEDFR
ncbi:Phenolphthiocerol synthesis polyketide synthase type I Pks15/1 [Lamellibrachia satsuma]|nr:Phenolphthiocerol synthesis polyketide synthase type I Pks15/1 [Lamellibrachia satsuma]